MHFNLEFPFDGGLFFKNIFDTIMTFLNSHFHFLFMIDIMPSFQNSVMHPFFS